MNTLESKNINLLIDFDSTIIKDESLELLSEISLKNPNDRKKIVDITNQAMNGTIEFSDALIRRIALLKAKKHHIEKVINKINCTITKSFIKNKMFFKKNNLNCYIISGGFLEIISPILEPFHINKKNIFANNFIYDGDDNIISIDIKNPLAQDKGKVNIAKNIHGRNIIIGDGYTDYEIKKFGYAEKFIQFSENINRSVLNPLADHIAYSFDDVINYIQKIYNI